MTAVGAINWQRHNRDYDPVDELLSYYRPLRAISQSVDVIPPTVPLGQYKLVLAPGLNLLSEAALRNLTDYVRTGGHFVLGQRSAMKDGDSGLFPERQPGPLVELLGGRVEQYYAVNFGKSEHIVTLPHSMEEVLTRSMKQLIPLPVYRVAVLLARR